VRYLIRRDLLDEDAGRDRVAITAGRGCRRCSPGSTTMAGSEATPTASGPARIGGSSHWQNSLCRPATRPSQPPPSMSWPGSTTVCGIHPGWSTGCRVRTPASTATRSARVRGSDSQARSAPNDLPRPSSPGSGQTAAGTATTGSRFSQVHVWLTDPVRAQLRRGAHSLGRASASLPQGQAGWESSWTWSWWGLESAD
jgi:hypothetical protein